MISQADLDQLFSAEKEHGEEVAASFKAFVKSLDDAIPDGLEKNKLINYLHEASGWAHTALATAEQKAKNLLHQRAKSGEKPATASQDAPPPAEIPTQEAVQTPEPTTSDITPDNSSGVEPIS